MMNKLVYCDACLRPVRVSGVFAAVDITAKAACVQLRLGQGISYNVRILRIQ
jgi:hypothetical protein